MNSQPHQIVIVGGGAGGLELATRLGDSLGRKKRAEITLIDRARTHLWKPLLHQAAAGSLDIVVIGQRESYSSHDGSSATKTPTPIIDVPQAVTAITSDQLEDQNIRQLGEALRYVPGVSMESGEGQRDEVFIRGQETTADFYLDGLRDDAEYYRSLYNIDRVEVLKGANALIFGRGAGGGAINRVSKKASLTKDVTAAHLSADSYGGFALSGDLSRPLSGDVAFRINGTYEEFDNHRNFYEGRFVGISPTVTAALGQHTTLHASYSYDDDRRVTDRGLPSLGGRPLEP